MSMISLTRLKKSTPSKFQSSTFFFTLAANFRALPGISSRNRSPPPFCQEDSDFVIGNDDDDDDDDITWAEMPPMPYERMTFPPLAWISAIPDDHILMVISGAF